MFTIGNNIGIGSRFQQGANLNPFVWRVVETKTRIASQNIVYTGVVRMVGVGQTYSTLTAAAAAANDLDILQLVAGTYLTSAESGGYWLVNANTKRLLVRGDANDPSAVIIAQTGVASYGIRLRDCNSMTFENVTFSTNQAGSLIASEAYASNNYFKAKNCIFISTNTSSNARMFNRTSSDTGTNTIRIEFEDCTFNQAGSSPPVTYISSGVNETILYKNCILNATGSGPSITYLSANKGTIAVYDCTINSNSLTYAINFGEDGTTFTYSTFKVDCRNTTINGTTEMHGILAGTGTDLIYCVNNNINLPAISSGSYLGFVIKTRASVIGNAYFAGNKVNSCRPLYIKAGKNCIFKYNTFLTNAVGFASLSVTNVSALFLSSGNIIENNNLFGSDFSIYGYISGAWEQPSVTMQGWTVNNNNYFSSTGIWLKKEDGTEYSFAQKNNFWTNSNDGNSKFLTKSTLGPEKTITDDTVIN